MAERPGDFWSFSLAVYGRPGVAPALIALQDRHGLEVNLLLYCCWRAAAGAEPDAAELAEAEAAVEPWQAAAVRPLRVVRRRLKPGIPGLPAAAVEGFRRQVEALEIEGERIAQERLAGLRPAAAGTPSRAAAERALRRYLERKAIAPAPADRAALETLLAACFD